MLWDVSKDATPDYAPQYTIYDNEANERVGIVFGDDNARLIAAAPDLLDALRLALDFTDNRVIVAVLESAIAKATSNSL